MARRLAAIMFTDIAGYTALAQADESGALRLLQEQERLFRPLIEAHRGRKVKSMGDGLLIEFPDALDAVECGVDLQRHVHERNARMGTQPLQLRVGIHLGDVQRRGTDVLGDTVNIASRVEPLAEPGGLCLSAQVFDQVHNKVPYQLEKLGPQSLKGVQEPIDVYRVVLPWTVPEATAGGPPPLRLAVLPLTNMSPDPTDEYFADGLTEELISSISRVRNLNVISRTSVMQYKTRPKRAAEIGRELDVGTILEGSVRKAGNKVRIAVQLIDPVADKHLWAENYDRNLDDIFAIQSEIAEKVAAALKIRLMEDQRANLHPKGTRDLDAYALLLKGRYYLRRWDAASKQTAIRYFEQALAIDPGYAAAYAALAGAYGGLLGMELIDPATGSRRFEEYAERALQLDETAAECHELEAAVLSNRWDWDGAERELRRALDLNPNLASAHGRLAMLLMVRGNVGGGLQEVEKALSLDPASVGAAGRAGMAYLAARRYERAIELLRNALELDRMDFYSLHNLGLAHVQVGEVEKGIEELERARKQPGPRRQDACLAYAYCKAGKTEEARRLLNELLHPAEGEPIPSAAVAGVYGVLGERDKAVEWLERAYAERDQSLQFLPLDLVFDDLQDDPRVQSLVRRMNLARAPPDQLRGSRA